MNEIYDIGIHIVVYIQKLGGWLLSPMQLFSLIGSEVFYLLIVLAVYWCASTEAGLRMGLFLMLSGGINDALKVAFHRPRPYWYSSDVKALAAEPAFGLPSGHAQHAFVFWSTLALWIKRRWMWVTAILLILLISFSRMYLGVHFPTDILAGWLVGFLLVGCLLGYERKTVQWFLRQQTGIQLLTALLASLVILGLGAAARLALGHWQMPTDWADNAARAGAGIPNPLDPTGIIANGGAFFGMIAGAIGLRRSGGFAAGNGTESQMAARYFLGLAGTLILWYGLGSIFPRDANYLSYILRYLRYVLVGIWFTGLAPITFIRLGLAERKRS